MISPFFINKLSWFVLNNVLMVDLVIVFFIGVVVSIFVMYLVFNLKINKIKQQNEITEKENYRLNNDIINLNVKLDKLENDFMQAKMHVVAVDAENTHLINANQEKQKEIEILHEKLTKEFESIANRILVERSKEVSDHNNQKIADILSPLKERILQFEKKVDDAYEKEVRDKLSLKAEVTRLFELNHKISEEAGNLTRALKGDVKKLGNWGEVILERVLEQSGLTKGREYRREVVDENLSGNQIRPDVIVDLPEGKHIIIDSKLSLYSYEKFINSSDEKVKAEALKSHKERLRQHVKDLFEKNYISAKKLNTPDFVLMFIPVEASFAVAVENDTELFSFAWEKKIVPVSPSTLLATLKTVSSIWRQENQNKNAMEIARQSGALYDKFVGFITDIEKIGGSMQQLQNNYDSALSKLQSGKGNLISRAEKIKKLGAKSSKSIDDRYLNN